MRLKWRELETGVVAGLRLWLCILVGKQKMGIDRRRMGAGMREFVSDGIRAPTGVLFQWSFYRDDIRIDGGRSGWELRELGLEDCCVHD